MVIATAFIEPQKRFLDVVETLRIPPKVIDAVVRRELQELERRERKYRAGRPFPELRGKTVFWSTTASRLARQCVRRRKRCVTTAPLAWWLRCPPAQPRS